MRFLKLLPAAILPALFACKSTDTRYESDRTAQTGAYSESERASRDDEGSSYAHSDYNRGVSTVDLRASGGESDLKGTATLLKNQDGDAAPRLIVHLENAQPGTYQVALASTCDFKEGAWSDSAGGSASAGAGISDSNRSDVSAGGSAGVTGDAEGDESLGGSASAGADLGKDGDDDDLGATARVGAGADGDEGLSGSASIGAEGGDQSGSFGGQLGMNKDLGTLKVGEDGTGHFEETLTDARIEQSAAIVVRRMSDEGSTELSERTASEGRMDGTLIAACGLISLPATAGEWNEGNARFNNDPREFDSDGQNLGDMNDQDTIVDD